MKKGILILSAFALYLLALNPYLGPSNYDDVVYLLGAESLAKGDGYLFQGKLIGDWPPLFSFLLSLPMRAGYNSVLAAKLVVLTAILISFFAVYKLMQDENRDNKAVTFLLFALSPLGFIFGSRVMSEWVFISLAYLYLLSLYQVDKQLRFGKWHMLAAIFFGLSMLTRYAGIFLIVPLFADLLMRKDFRLKSWFKKGGIALIGLSLFLFLWIIPLKLALARGMSEVRYYQNVAELVTIDFRAMLEANFQLLTGIDTHSTYLILSLPLIALLLYGFYKRINTHGLMYGDYWAITTLIVCFLLSSKTARYLLPIAPFLFSYVITAINSLFTKRKVLSLCSIWLMAFGVMDLFLLTKGNQSSYHGLNILASPSPASFYRGYWRDLYNLAEAINSTRSDETIKFAGNDLVGEKYLYYFTGRAMASKDQKGVSPSLILMARAEFLEQRDQQRDDAVVYQNDSFVLLSKKW